MTDFLDCLCAGIVVADTVCHPIAKMPPAGGLAKTERTEFSIGGCSANIAVDMARLGLRVGLAGKVGDDLFGREVRDRLAKSGVDVSRMETSTRLPTSSTYVLNVEGEDRRFIHCVGANAEFDGSEITEKAIQTAKLLYVGGFCLLESLTPERVARLFRVAQKNGVKTVLNVVLSESTDTVEWLNPVLPLTDFFLCNNDEAARITRQTDPFQQAIALRAIGVGISVVTQGEKGAVLISDSERLHSGIYPVKAVDGTGTGDAFAAGFLYGVLKGNDLQECLRLGTAMGASCVRSMGATTGVFHADELVEFVRSRSLPIETI